MKKLLLIFACMLTIVSAAAQTKAEADSAYVQEDYEKAISIYNQLLETGVSAPVYYNLGNAYYRKGDMAHAILAYERAYLLDPGDDQWGRAVVVCFALFVLATLVYFFVGRLLWRKVGFGVGLTALCLAVLFHIFAYQQQQKLLQRSYAIVLSSSLTVKSTPSNSGTDLFVLHEGTKVQITDDAMKDWKEIRLADGKVGWVPVKTIERI